MFFLIVTVKGSTFSHSTLNMKNIQTVEYCFKNDIKMVQSNMVIHPKKSYSIMLLGLWFFCMAAYVFHSHFEILKVCSTTHCDCVILSSYVLM